ncbi:HNH endonuclease [Burkholderia multivorans]|uniref:HNH endonuclease n=1 Tax=Burkholderia multivorans TaxID=87883 RepID=UPI000CFFA2C4|nr:HNH endonuclease signature motif containing protein [Burkholderia multivorans]MBU9403468.1 HNH endonuclease [Burkholderia multivorans]MDN8051572.1 HNH endonuclease signature motif containing protein [Burkholderia multivorans]PRH23052.1 HNH endonuclease [Burkholderia multivorans]
MDKSISRFFTDLGVPLHNDRWSWGAERGNVIVLRTWADQYDSKTRRVGVLQIQTLVESISAGLDERVRQLKKIWQGGIAAYTIVATAVDPDVKQRSIESYRDDLFPIESIEVDDDGTLIAQCASKWVSARDFPTHAASHLTAAGNGVFPIEQSLETGLSSSNTHAKLPYIRNWLIDLARRRSTAIYAELMNGYDLWYGTLFTALKLLGEECVAAGEPVITSLVVQKDTARCSDGFRKVFGIENDAAERERCYAYWSGVELASVPGPQPDNVAAADPEITDPDLEQQTGLDDRVARFMTVEVRQQQPAFRKAVFEAYDGRCAISGCDVPEALEAAHLAGRNWREGHNEATDGILLRRDLHTLYDRGLLDFDDGIARFSPRVLQHYASLEGVSVDISRESAVSVISHEFGQLVTRG